MTPICAILNKPKPQLLGSTEEDAIARALKRRFSGLIAVRVLIDVDQLGETSASS